jgi:hypothetical protein
VIYKCFKAVEIEIAEIKESESHIGKAFKKTTDTLGSTANTLGDTFKGLWTSLLNIFNIG